MNTINVLSTIAMAVGLAAALPQILRMLRTRSSGGQSVLGWAMGLVTNLSMAYVNLFGFGAVALMASNVLSGALCVAAIALILRFGAGEPELAVVASPFDELTAIPAIELRRVPPPMLHASVAELPTTEFAALQAAVQTSGEHRAAHARHARRGCPGERDESLQRVA